MIDDIAPRSEDRPSDRARAVILAAIEAAPEIAGPAKPAMTVSAKAADPSEEETAPEFSEDQIALAFVERMKDSLVYVAAWTRWYVWTGKRWIADDTLAVYDKIRKICRDFAARCAKDKDAAMIASARTVAAVEKLARADRRVAGTTDQWDRDRFTLNTPNGEVDLRTGEMRPHDPKHFHRKMTSVSPRGDCPRWDKFMARVTGGNDELAQYLRRVGGYALTGDTSEHSLHFAYGKGANGKGVFVGTIGGILGDYHRTAAIEVFTASAHDHHPTELADLHGARLVSVTETEEGRRWAESRIKALTGGDEISARFMRQDFFKFTPKFKLLVTGNHKPGLRSVDESIRRRFHLCPFTETIPTEERDLHLKEKLQDEWPGILAWMIEGCLQWQEKGLSPPPAVIDATAAYLDGEDSLAAWIDERCERDANAWEPLTALYGSWSDWCVKAGEFAGTNRRFADNLESKGFADHRRNVGRGFFGLRIKVPASDYQQRGDYDD